MRTPLDFFKRIVDPTLRKKAVQNYDEDFFNSVIRKGDIRNLAEAFDKGFDWADSPEKDFYWEEIYNRAKEEDIELYKELKEIPKTREEILQEYLIRSLAIIENLQGHHLNPTYHQFIQEAKSHLK